MGAQRHSNGVRSPVRGLASHAATWPLSSLRSFPDAPERRLRAAAWQELLRAATNRTQAAAGLRDSAPKPQHGTPLPWDEIAALVRAAGNFTAAIHQADSTDQAELCKKLGIRLRYDPAQQKILVESHLDQDLSGSRGVPVRVGRAYPTIRTHWWRSGRWTCGKSDQCGGAAGLASTLRSSPSRGLRRVRRSGAASLWRSN